jgi:inorganic phosphate transporter, PiT family
MVVTPVITGSMEPRRVILLIAAFEFIGAWFLGTAVAQTLGNGIVNPSHISISAIFAAILAALLWNLGGWYWGMPSSSSHALIGGLVGAVAMGSGPGRVHWSIVGQILAILISAPMAGLLAGHYATQLFLYIFRNQRPNQANSFFKRFQIVTSITLALSHGSNDAQKGMGIISLALILFHKISPGALEKIYDPLPGNGFYVPKWVILACSLALALGVSSGGLRIMKTLGTKLYRVRPVHGFSAQAGSSVTIFLSSLFGFPVSTTQVVSSSILGAGSAQRLGSVRWSVAKSIFLTWVITIPGSAVLAALLVKILNNLIFLDKFWAMT